MLFVSGRFFALIGCYALLMNCCVASLKTQQFKKVEYCSQASQDHFVYFLLYELLDKRDDGYYLEIGAGHPNISSNTCFFDKKYGWHGVSLDISDEYKNLWWSSRNSLLLIEDAMQSDYGAILKSFPSVIDYLSLDIDHGYDIVLQKIPFEDHIFKIITIEHDFYRFGDLYRKEERRILSSLGYYLLCSNVSVFFNGFDSPFEDWWIHPSAFPPDVFTKLTSLDLNGKSHDQIISIIRNFWAAYKAQL